MLLYCAAKFYAKLTSTSNASLKNASSWRFSNRSSASELGITTSMTVSNIRQILSRMIVLGRDKNFFLSTDRMCFRA